MLRTLVIVGLSCMLCACGFHLRGTNNHSLSFQEVALIHAPSHDPFIEHLSVVLKSLGVTPQSKAAWQLDLTPLEFESFPIAYGPNGELVREKLQLKLAYELRHYQNVVLKRTLSNQRQHQLNIATKLADTAELEIILNEMKHDLAQQVIAQLSRV